MPRTRRINIFYDYIFEVTKYNPIFRDENGHFNKKDEWLDYSCIGDVDDDGLLTREKYLVIESK